MFFIARVLIFSRLIHGRFFGTSEMEQLKKAFRESTDDNKTIPQNVLIKVLTMLNAEITSDGMKALLDASALSIDGNVDCEEFVEFLFRSNAASASSKEASETYQAQSFVKQGMEAPETFQAESFVKQASSLWESEGDGFGEDSDKEGDQEGAQEAQKIEEQQRRPRRVSISAGKVSDDALKNYVKPVHPKDEDTKLSIQTLLIEDEKMSVLFGHLQKDALADVVNAFYCKEFEQGIDIIKQGDAGDCLYIVADGVVDIFVARPGNDGKIPSGERGPKVVSFGAGTLFGELALMYHAPRAATVQAASAVVKTYVLNADDFKMLLMQSGQAHYAKYEGWLSDVDILKVLNHFELARLAEILENDCFDADEDIITQGDAGDAFFILEDGTAAAYINGEDGEKEVQTYTMQGQYFGEIALLTSQPRRATVRATGEGCSVAYITRENFEGHLGPIIDILKVHVDKYPQYADFLSD